MQKSWRRTQLPSLQERSGTMEQKGFPRRIEQVGKEPLVVMAADQGHRVYALANPKESFMVRGLPDAPTSTCTESDAEEKCRHVLAVETLLGREASPEKRHPEVPKDTAA